MRKSILGSLGKSALAALGSLGARVPVAGDKAPDFEAESTAGRVNLADYAGKKHVVLAFYYADFTPV